MSPVDIEATVECYAGYKGEETPRAITIAGVRSEVLSVVSRERVLDPASGVRRDVWRCRLADGREAAIELLEDGTWRVSTGA